VGKGSGKLHARTDDRKIERNWPYEWCNECGATQGRHRGWCPKGESDGLQDRSTEAQGQTQEG